MEPLSRTGQILESLPRSWLTMVSLCMVMVSLPRSWQDHGKASKELAMDLDKDTMARTLGIQKNQVFMDLHEFVFVHCCCLVSRSGIALAFASSMVIQFLQSAPPTIFIDQYIRNYRHHISGKSKILEL